MRAVSVPTLHPLTTQTNASAVSVEQAQLPQKREKAASSDDVVGTKRPPEVVAFEIEVVSFFVEAADLLGVPRSHAAIYGICFASPEPLSFTEIAGRLKISTGSISQGLRILRDVGALIAVRSPWERRDRFAPDLGLRKVATHFIGKRLEVQLDASGAKLRAISGRAPRPGPSSEELTARLKALEGWHDQVRALLPLLKSLLRFA